MKLVNLTEFLKLPEGTVFASGIRYAFSSLSIKGETLPSSNDFYQLDVNWVEADNSGQAIDRLDLMLKKGVSFPMNTDYGRDGSFDANAVFLIYEAGDLEFLINTFIVARKQALGN